MTSAVSILVQRDFAGIEAAYREMLEHDLARCSAQALGVKQPEVEREFGDGYYRWVETLLRFEERRAVNQTLAPLADFTDGLVALGRARADFEREHPPCPHCSAPLVEAKDTFCWRCQQSWEEKK